MQQPMEQMHQMQQQLEQQHRWQQAMKQLEHQRLQSGGGCSLQGWGRVGLKLFCVEAAAGQAANLACPCCW
jgi:hypothetical protein